MSALILPILVQCMHSICLNKMIKYDILETKFTMQGDFIIIGESTHRPMHLYVLSIHNTYFWDSKLNILKRYLWETSLSRSLRLWWGPSWSWFSPRSFWTLRSVLWIFPPTSASSVQQVKYCQTYKQERRYITNVGLCDHDVRAQEQMLQKQNIDSRNKHDRLDIYHSSHTLTHALINPSHRSPTHPSHHSLTRAHLGRFRAQVPDQVLAVQLGMKVCEWEVEPPRDGKWVASVCV